MAKKKVARPAAAKKPASKARAARPLNKPAVRKKVAVKTAPAAKPAARRSLGKSSSKPAVREPGESLGRPLLTAEEKLYLLFKEDYHARQIFEFLRVETLGELEKYSPQQIIQILSTPLRKTVERIRERLAENRRHLRDDIEFARERLATLK